jgi:hypothetical protein
VARVESPEHALLECYTNLDVIALRSVFLGELFRAVPKLKQKMTQLNSIEFLKVVIYEHPTISLVAKYVHDVLEVFYATAVYQP